MSSKTDRNHRLFFRSLTLGCQTCTRAINSCRRTAAVLCTPPRRLWTAGRTEGRRWTAGLWASCCTHWFMEPCLLTDKTTRTWSSRSAPETTANPPNHQVRPLWNKRCDRNSSDLLWVLFYIWNETRNWFTVFVKGPNLVNQQCFIGRAYLFLADKVVNCVLAMCWPWQPHKFEVKFTPTAALLPEVVQSPCCWLQFLSLKNLSWLSFLSLTESQETAQSNMN